MELLKFGLMVAMESVVIGLVGITVVAGLYQLIRDSFTLSRKRKLSKPFKKST